MLVHEAAAAAATTALALLLLGLQGSTHHAWALSKPNWQCRTGPASTHVGCALPYELGNFQGNYQCNPAVKVGRASTVEELQQLVKLYPRVKASGIGHSWWAEQACAGNTSSAVNVVMTELQSTLEMMSSPVDPVAWINATVHKSFPIHVDEDAATVRVAAGITQRVLLDYLSEYTHWKQPSGWTLPAFSWYLDQTIGGAVATGTHGSSMRYGSLSSQLRGIQMILANGSLVELTPASNLHLFLAAGVSVGRLGVITQVVLAIKPQQAVQRSLKTLSVSDFVRGLKGTQDAYVAAKAAGNVTAMKRALFEVDETQAFWAFPTATVYRTDYQHLDHDPDNVVLNIQPQDDAPLVSAMSGPDGAVVFDQLQVSAVPPRPSMGSNTAYWNQLYVSQLLPALQPGTFESRKAFLSMSSVSTVITSTYAPYDQLEVSVPLDIAADCLATVSNAVYGPQRLWDGFRSPVLVRFVTGEDFYLSTTHGGPRMYLNIEDYVSRSMGGSTGSVNKPWHDVIALFRTRCGARLHWGKAGWPQFAKNFDGAVEYPQSWCHFGCAAAELDPTAKFSSAWDGWRWNATKGGAPVADFAATCCTASGFSPDCTCAPRS